MRKLTSVNYSSAAFNTAMLLLRIGSGTMFMSHGYSKLVQFAEMKGKFMNFMGLGSTVSLSLVIFSEFFCAIFINIGLFTRLVVIPPIISSSVALFVAHNGEIFGDGEKAALYVVCFIVILLCGPGRASVDGMIK
ncbi:MAG TPA: DoxX family protein [Chitinophagaceae bacterium]|nr:DoxX family protein [Chitinophagaceae bacterium]